MKSYWLCDWCNDDFGSLENGVLLARHRLNESGLFSDEALIDILDNHPDDHLTISAKHIQGGRCKGERQGASSQTLLQLVRSGHLEMTVCRLMDFHPEHAKVVNDIYYDLEENSPGFRAEQRNANLWLSSPAARVPYRVDLPVNMLWHLRGRKRVWVYPHFDNRFASQKVMELICSGELKEELPYDSEFDKYALVYDVEPSQLLTWPQHTPYRAENLDGLCVSLMTEHMNPRSVRRNAVHIANHFLRTRLKRLYCQANVNGPAAHAKQALARAFRAFEKWTRTEPERETNPKMFIVDRSQPNGIRFLSDEPAPIVAANRTCDHSAIKESRDRTGL